MTARDILGAVLHAHPKLVWSGWWTRRTDPDGLSQARCETLEPYGLGQFGRAMIWLQTAPRTRTINSNQTCYFWKHQAEHLHNHGQNYEDYYVGEGALIAACFASGLTVKRRLGETYVNLAECCATIRLRGMP